MYMYVYIYIHILHYILLYYLREFALDTTVILAQPRVPRLRADAVYVDHQTLHRAVARELQDP